MAPKLVDGAEKERIRFMARTLLIAWLRPSTINSPTINLSDGQVITHDEKGSGFIYCTWIGLRIKMVMAASWSGNRKSDPPQPFARQPCHL